MFTRNKTARMTRIRPKPAYSFFPIVIAKCLRSPRNSAACLEPRRFKTCCVLLGALLGSMKFEFHNLRGFFRSRRELPLSHRVLARLHEQRMSADNPRGFDTSIRTDDHFDLHLACDVHAPSKVRVDRRDPGLYLALRFIRGSGLCPAPDARQNEKRSDPEHQPPPVESHRHVPYEE